jgi:hypothetical protein
MKVRVEYEPATAGYDPESFYDAVEFETVRAQGIEGWADAVMDFVRPSIYGRKAILLESLYLASEGGDLSPFFVKGKKTEILELIEWLQDSVAKCEKLDATESASKTESTGEESGNE